MVVGPGDDAAVTLPGGATATSVDAVVDGVHFRRQWSTPAQIGHKALATALSDLAAMGATAGEAYLVLFVPPEVSEADCFAIQEGAARLAEQSGCALAGGDLVRGPALSLAVTVVGHADKAQDLVTRAGARAGDLIVLTGRLGGAPAGLALLKDPSLAARAGLSEPAAAALIRRQLEPQPRLDAGRALAAAGATAMIDLSDGLGADAGHLAQAGRVHLLIEVAAIPLAPGLAEIAAAVGLDAEEMAAGGGEDYELLACLPPAALEDAHRNLTLLGLGLTPIGEVRAGQGAKLLGADGRALKASGYDQLR